MLASSRFETDIFDAVLRQLDSGAAAYFGDPQAVVCPVRRLDGPFSSLLRVRIRTAVEETHAFVKVLKTRGTAPEEIADRRRLLENEYRTTLHLYQECLLRPGLTALRPIAVFPEHLAIVTAEVPGRTFDRVLRRAVWGLQRPSLAIDAARRVGAWIRTYQTLPPHGGATVGRSYLDVRLRGLVGTVLTSIDREFALDACETLTRLDPAGAASRVAIHGDLCATNIIVQDTGEVAVLDFMTAKTGTRYHDAAHLFLHLENEALRVPLRRPFLRSMQRALLEGFDPSASPEAPLFKLMILQHSACQLALLGGGTCGQRRIRALRRRWQRLMPLWAPEGVRAPR